MKINYLIIAFIVGLFVVKTQAQVITYTDNFTTSVSADWTEVNGTWTVTGGVLQSNTTGADPKKLLLTKEGYYLSSSTAQQIVAKVRVDSWVGGSEDRAGVCLISTTDTDGSHRGYSFLLRPGNPGNTINFLSDKLAWGTAVPFPWTTGTWYWMKLKIDGSPLTLSGKIWKDGDSEPDSWTITQALGSGNWNLSDGHPGVVGSAVTGTGVSYDDVTVSAPTTSFITYIEKFNSSTIGTDWTVKNGTWSVSGGVGQESSTGTSGDPKKLRLTKPGYDIARTNPQMMVAKVRVDTWSNGDNARAGVSLLNDGNGSGYCLLFHDDQSTLQFLNDGVAWSSAVTFNWSTSTWYWFKIQYEDNTLKGKVWADGSSEPADWTITQTGWTGRTKGQAALVSGSKGSGYSYASVSFDEVMFADPRYVESSASDVADPTSFTATANGSAQIDLSWVKNGSNNNVMVAWNSTNSFGTPSGTYSVGNPISGGGTVLYNGSGTTYNHTGLTPNTPYYYKAWSVEATPAYSAGVTANATTAAATVIKYVTPNGAGNNDGTSWANAYSGTQLQTAINASGVTQVWVKAGTYKPTSSSDRTISFRMKNGVAIYGGFAGTEDPATFDLDDRDFETNVTILSGDLTGDDNYSTVPATNISDNTYQVVYNNDQNPDINSTAILDGFTIKGGNANYEYGANLGGGIYNFLSSPTLKNLTVSNNSADSRGGGMFNTISSPTLINCSFTSNSAAYGGGMTNYSSSSPTLTNCTFTSNSASEYGSGMYNKSSSPALTNCAFTSNSADYGGGMFNENSSSPSLKNCIFTTNSAITGGGIYNLDSSPILINCTFSSNSASNQGGGMFNNASLTLNNCIVWGNSALNDGNQFYISAGTTTLNYSCYADGENDVHGTPSAINCITNDPKFVDAATSDVRLYGNSPCKNTGLNTYNTQPTDIRGQERIQNTTIDMGAYEWTNGIDPAYLEVRRYVTTSGGAVTQDGTSWENAYPGDKLQTAINENDVTDVWVASGTYKPTSGIDRTISFRMKNNVAIYGGFAGTETLLSQRNIGTNVTILSGDLNGDDNYSTVPATNTSENTYHVVYNPTQDPFINNTAVLDGFTIRGGNANGVGTSCYGGGVYNYLSSPTIRNVVVSNNFASSGAGLYNYTSSPILTNALVTNNYAATFGGGLFMTWGCYITLNNVTIADNSAVGSGGGVHSHYSATTLNNCVIWGNTSAEGNQIYMYAQSTITLNHTCYSYGSNDVDNEGTTFTATNNNITTNPKFVNAANGDFRICGNSPCVNTGLNSYNTQATDIRGQVRIQNTNIDMGAYEWTSGTDPDQATMTWSGGTSTDWNVDNNWVGGLTPYTTDNAIIPAGVSHFPAITAAITCNNLTINSSAVVTVNAGGQFTVSGTLTNNAGVGGLVIKSESNTSTGSLKNSTTGVLATVERWMTGDIWHLISPAATGQTASAFIGDTGNSIARNATNYGLAPYRQTDNEWDYFKVAEIVGNLDTIAKGYQVLRNANGFVSFKGILAGGDKTIKIARSSYGWNLIGNPYPCALDVKLFLDANRPASNGKIDADFLAIYVADIGNPDNVNGYTPINYVTEPELTFKLASGEGFFVKSVAGGGNINFTTTMKSHDSDDFKSAVIQNGFNLVAESGGNKMSTSMKYIPQMTVGLDPGWDAGLFDNGDETSFSLYTALVEDNGVDFTIQCLPDNDYENLVVPVGITAKKGATVTFSLADVTIPVGYKVFLEDRVNKKFTRLDEQGSIYSVKLNTASAGTGQFFLHTKQEITGIKDALANPVLVIPVPQNRLIRVSGLVNLPAQATVYDMNGRTITIKTLTSVNENEIQLNGVSNGIYLLKIKSGTGTTQHKISWTL